MKGCAKFLNFIALIVFILFVLGTLAIGAGAAFIGLKPELVESAIFEQVAGITVNGQPMTTEMFAVFRMPVLIILGCMTVLMILGLIALGNIRTALKEVSNETPFSVRCSKALHTAAVLVAINGIASIGMSVYSYFALAGMEVTSANSTGPVTTITANLSFILVAIFLQMLSRISEFGRR